MSILVENLRFGYTSKEILRGVSLSSENGQLMAVLGPNGVGKTTLFRCILGLERRYSGRILIDGDDAAGLPEKERAGRIAFIPQIRPQVFGYTVMDMVLMGTSHGLSRFSVPGEKEKKAAKEALERMEIGYLAQNEFVKISGGEQQLVLIARALAQNSKTLLMDEPTSALDYGNQSRVMRSVRNLADQGYCVVLSTHNPQHAVWFADRAVALFDGIVAADGPPEEIMTQELISRLYRLEVSVIDTPEGKLISPAGTKKRNG